MKKKIALIIAGILILLGVGVYWGTSYVFNKTIVELGKGIGNITENRSTAEETYTEQSENGSTIPKNTNTPGGETQQNNSQNKGMNPNKHQAGSGETKSNSNGSNTSQTEISQDKLNQIQKNITFKDKYDVIKLVLSRLSSADIAELRKLAEGGVTAEEKGRIKQIIFSKFSAQEVSYLRAVYNKYK